MAGARHLRGTILTRVSGLLKAEAISKKPVWFDVMEAFPPIMPTKINRKPEAGRAVRLEFPEDFFRRHFYNSSVTIEALDLRNEHQTTQCDRFVRKCQELVKQGMNQEEALNNVLQYYSGSSDVSFKRDYQTTDADSTHSEANYDYEDDDILDLDEFLNSIENDEKKKD